MLAIKAETIKYSINALKLMERALHNYFWE